MPNQRWHSWSGSWVNLFLLQARMVAAATSNLCEAANASVQGHASEEKLISSAKQVAASTAQLLVACKVKADHNSEAMRRLQVTQEHNFTAAVWITVCTLTFSICSFYFSPQGCWQRCEASFRQSGQSSSESRFWQDGGRQRFGEDQIRWRHCSGEK